MAEGLKVLIAEPRDFSKTAIRRLQSIAEVEQRSCAGHELASAFKQYDAIWLRLANRIDAAIIGSAPRCRVLAAAVTGIDHIDVDACEAAGVEIVCLKGEVDFLREIRATAELTVGLAIALMRHLPHAANSVRDGVWDRDLFRGRELFGKTLGIVGVGRLGSIVADYFHAFGMCVVGFDCRTDHFDTKIEMIPTLDELLSRADVLSLHVSYNAGTHHLIGAAEFAKMRQGAVLINTSRGAVVDNDALITALDNKTLGGAALDVIDGEPNIEPEHPIIRALERFDNLRVVPHVGGNSYESFEKTELFIADKMVTALTRLSRGLIPDTAGLLHQGRGTVSH